MIDRLKMIYRLNLNASIFSFVHDSSIGNFCGIEKGVIMHNTVLGDFSYINKFSKVENCSIGKFSCIGENVKIGGFYNHKKGISIHPSFHSLKPPINFSFFKDKKFISSKKIIIGNDVFIGTGAYILDGIEIGDGCIIGAKSIVTKSVPPYSVVVGNPAQIKSKRFSDSEIQKLIKVKWWNWDIEKIKSKASHISEINTNFLDE